MLVQFGVRKASSSCIRNVKMDTIPRVAASLRFADLSTVAKPSPSSARKMPAPITLTEKAAERIKELLSEKSDAIGVKIGVKRRGCNGYSYTMNYADQEYMATTKDEKVNAYGVNVLVDPKAIFFLVGTEMDFVETALSSEFTFTNPNSKGSCGCGESFNV
jgi:iron-sulfur cluster assembly accessory protein